MTPAFFFCSCGSLWGHKPFTDVWFWSHHSLEWTITHTKIWFRISTTIMLLLFNNNSRHQDLLCEGSWGPIALQCYFSSLMLADICFFSPTRLGLDCLSLQHFDLNPCCQSCQRREENLRIPTCSVLWFTGISSVV